MNSLSKITILIFSLFSIGCSESATTEAPIEVEQTYNASKKNISECIEFTNNQFTLKINNKVYELKIFQNYILINNKYKAYSKGLDWNDDICDEPGEVYANKEYTYRINHCATADSYFIDIKNSHGLNTQVQCSW